ncbi:MAG: ABC-type transporter, integral rane subunit [Firmicutes bacterium]|nr:ABC-type transporter, integral rane subunit [Bacillota bacterium]
MQGRLHGGGDSLTRYVIRRILIAVPVLLGITVLSYLCMRLAPGSPIDLLVDPNATAAEIERQRHLLGLDQPVVIQYFKWLGQLLHGELGYSMRSSKPVINLILARIGPTALLAGTSLVIAYVVGIPLGVLSATRAYTLWDYGSMTLAFLAAAIPNFFLGLVAIYVFSVKLKMLPLGGMYDPGTRPGVLALTTHLIMPALVLAGAQLGALIRQVRSAVLETLNEDYVRTARAKGVAEQKVLYKHALRNALVPIITLFGLSLPFLVGGSVVTEQVFSWPGLGTFMIQSIGSRDYPAIMGVTVLIAIAVLIGNLLTDLAYGLADPRIRYE